MGISDPKKFKDFEFWKRIRPVGVNHLMDIQEIYKFHMLMGSTMRFYIWCKTGGVIGRKLQLGFHF